MQKQLERYDDGVDYQNDLSTICPSFSSYSSSSGNNTATIREIAIKVSDEVRTNYKKQNCSNSGLVVGDFVEDSDDEDDEFEFALIDVDDADLDFTLVTGEDNQFKFHHHHPMFPVFNREISSKNNDGDRKVIDEFESSSSGVPILPVSLRNLFLVDDDRACDILALSASEPVELGEAKPEMYCVWTPKPSPQPSPERCKKSNSTGSKLTNPWSLRALLRRSNSHGKPPFVYLTKKSISESSKSKQDRDKNSNNDNNASASPSNVGKKLVPSKSSAHEVFYVRNRALKEGDKRRSYLPYRQHIFGAFASNINRLSMTKTLPPF